MTVLTLKQNKLGRPGPQRFALTTLFCALFLSGCAATAPGQELSTTLLNDITDVLDSAEQTYEPPVNVIPTDEHLMALIPEMSLSDDLLVPVAERFNVVANNENAKDFFNNLVSGTDYGVTISPQVEGQISINLPNVSIDDVMEVVQEIYGYQITRRDRVYQIQPPGLQTRIFSIDYLNVSRTGNSSASITSGGAGGGAGGLSGGAAGGLAGGFGGATGGFGGSIGGFGGSTGGFGGTTGAFTGAAGGLTGGAVGSAGGGGGGQVSTRTDTDFWTDIKATLEGMLGVESSSPTQNAPAAGGSGLLAGLGAVGTTARASASRDESGKSVVVQPQVGLIMVTATPAELERVSAYIDRAQDILSREVTIQVQFLEVILNKGFQSAIDFDTFGPGGAEEGDNSVTGSFGAGTEGVTFTGISNPLSIATNFTDFNAVFRILESRGTTQVLSSPSLKVLNNQKALFQDGDQEFFQTSSGSNVVNTGTSVTESSSNNLQPFFSGISMDITPQISADGTITLHVHPIITTVSEQNKSVGGQQVPLARTSVRELDSIIRAQDGRIVILGGLAYERSIDDMAGIPGVNDIPLIGGAFDQRRESTVKSEFIILLRPVIANPQSEQNLIRERSDRVRSINNAINPFSN